MAYEFRSLENPPKQQKHKGKNMLCPYRWVIFAAVLLIFLVTLAAMIGALIKLI